MILLVRAYKTSKRYFWTGCQNVVRRDFGSRVAFSSLCPLPSCQIPRPRQGRGGEKMSASKPCATGPFHIVHGLVPLNFSEDRMQYLYERQAVGFSMW